MSEETKAPDRLFMYHVPQDPNHAHMGSNERITDSDVVYIRADVAERYRAMLEKIGNLPGQDAFHKELVREALHHTQPAEGEKK